MWETIINIGLVVLSVVFAFLSYYFQIRRKIVEQAEQEIANAQDVTEDNAERMAYVVSQLYSIVPAPLRVILTKKRIEELAQRVFDRVKEYATKHESEKQKGVEK